MKKQRRDKLILMMINNPAALIPSPLRPRYCALIQAAMHFFTCTVFTALKFSYNRSAILSAQDYVGLSCITRLQTIDDGSFIDMAVEIGSTTLVCGSCIADFFTHISLSPDFQLWLQSRTYRLTGRHTIP